jgi:hypothetical protein
MPLQIAGKEIEMLSGPVSMYIISPTDEFLRKQPYAPIFILFGDVHGGSENFCLDPIYYEDDNIRNYKTYRVHHQQFLELLSKAVEKEYKKDEDKEERRNEVIDFYLEGSIDLHLISSYIPTTNHPIDWYWGWMSKCYSNKRLPPNAYQESFKKDCEVMKNIRWQSADIRTYVTQKKEPNLWNFLKELIFVKLRYFPPTFDGFYACIYYNIYNDPQRIKGILGETIIDNNRFYDLYVHKKGSLIRKQLEKILYDDSKTNVELKKNLEQRFNKYIKDVIKKFMPDENIMKTVSKVYNILKGVINAQPLSDESRTKVLELYNTLSTKVQLSDSSKNEIEIFMEYLLITRSLMLDLYAIARSYKIFNNSAFSLVRDKNISYPLINVYYFGNAHVSNIRNFFTDEEYNTSQKIAIPNDFLDKLRSDQVPRCLMMSAGHTVNIDDIIKRLRQKRDDHEKEMVKKNQRIRY